MIFHDSVMELSYGYANMNDAAILWEKNHNSDPDARPFTNPDIAHEAEEEYHRLLGIEWSYDGWMQDRSCIRRGTYLEKDERWIHIGVDVNANELTEVLAAIAGEIVYVGTDAPLVGGWGNHVIQIIEWKGKPHALLYAHLGAIEVSVGNILDPYYGDAIGLIGSKETNGFWRPHLHLQLFADIEGVTDWKKFSDEIDGYVRRDEIATWARKCPDPTPLIFAKYE